jgi:prepilin-type N-terminal cleavage/methylation domain-containing protein
LSLHNEYGFSLIELLAVIGVFLVLSTISIIAWNASGPSIALNGSAQGLGDALELCMLKAHNHKNEFFVLLNYGERIYRTNDDVTLNFPGHSYVLVNDDGWDPTDVSRTRMYNVHTRHDGLTPEFRPEWIPDEPDFRSSWRNNNMIESREIFRGPIRLGRSVIFQQRDELRAVPVRIVFTHRLPYMYWHGMNVPVNRAMYDHERRVDPAHIYMSNRHYQPDLNTLDNKVHLRLIRVMSQKIEVIRQPA